MNIGEMLGIYNLEIKHSKLFRASKQLGNIIGNTNSNNKCIKERIMMGNRAY